jgi:O-antigen ligase
MERQQTAIEEGRDSGRLEIWRGGLNLLVDQPLGVGANGFALLSPQYIPEIVEQKKVELRNVHNTYLYVGTSWGIQGLVVFSLFLINTLLILHKTRKEIQVSDHRLVVESIALELSLVGYLVVALFGVYFKNEVLYWLSGLTAALWNIHRDEEATRSDQSTQDH